MFKSIKLSSHVRLAVWTTMLVLIQATQTPANSTQATSSSNAPSKMLDLMGPASSDSGSGARTRAGTDVMRPSSAGRNYLNGVYANPADTSTPKLIGSSWDYTINYSYQDNKPGGGVAGVYRPVPPLYPLIVDLFHVNTSYDDAVAAADGRYNAFYRKTAQSLASGGRQIYAVRIDSEFNGSWSAWKPSGQTPASAQAWIAGFRNLAQAVMEALPGVKVIWNPALGQNDPFPFYPGDDAVDLIGPDVYCQPKFHRSSADCWADVVSGFGGINLTKFAEFARQHGKPLAIPEWADSFGDGYMIGQMRNWMDNNNVVAQTYWNSGDALARSASLTTLPDNQRAYAAAFGHRPYIGTYWPKVTLLPSDNKPGPKPKAGND